MISMHRRSLYLKVRRSQLQCRKVETVPNLNCVICKPWKGHRLPWYQTVQDIVRFVSVQSNSKTRAEKEYSYLTAVIEAFA